jgi:hypothetical protein
MKSEKIAFMAITLVTALAFIEPAIATSVREFQKMTKDDAAAFLVKETEALLVKVKTYDPKLAEKTRNFMLFETNEFGYVKGLGVVLATIDVSEKRRPETMDVVQVETITKVVMRNFWKEQGIVVPNIIFGTNLPPAPAKP